MNMKAFKNKHLNKAFMWYKVRELFSKGLNKTQISLEVGVHRKTVRLYLAMNEDEFYKWIEQPKNRPKKLNDYYEYVKKLLEAHPYLSAAQVEDRLKEDFRELPVVHSKTVYNFVQSIRNANGIRKQDGKPPRQFEKLPETDYGHQAQVDFGQYSMPTQSGSRVKVYFFVMILCRSRQKFVYFQTTPFTASSAIEAHNRAFEFFKGQPREIIYDQDRVLITDENLGDFLLTQEFNAYCGQMNFKPVFCRKSDPQSKGKIENVVKYVKYSFLRGRIYYNIDLLNQSGIKWLHRTANAKEHAGIKKIPASEWLIEQPYLIPLKASPEKITTPVLKYKVRKDNTINYKSNFYSLPLGTYQGPDTWILLKPHPEEIHLYSMNEQLLAVHPLCYERGMVIRNSNHGRERSQSILQLKEDVLQMMPDQDLGQVYLERLNKEKSRYIRDNLLLMKKHMPAIAKDDLNSALRFCLENSLFNAARFIEVAHHYQKESQWVSAGKIIVPDITLKKSLETLDFIPQVSKLNTYENIL
jgi:transposase